MEMQKFIDYMNKLGLVMVRKTSDKDENAAEDSNRRHKDKTGRINCETESLVTIYRTAVQPASKRDSSSSDDQQLDMSDEADKLQIENLSIAHPNVANQEIEKFIADAQNNRFENDREMAHSSSQPGGAPYRHAQLVENNRDRNGERHQVQQIPRAEQMIRDSEASKARIHSVPGNKVASEIDEEYILIGSHVDELTRQKIGNGEYVDFSKLIPKDKIQCEEDHRMEIVNRGHVILGAHA